MSALAAFWLFNHREPRAFVRGIWLRWTKLRRNDEGMRWVTGWRKTSEETVLDDVAKCIRETGATHVMVYGRNSHHKVALVGFRLSLGKEPWLIESTGNLFPRARTS